MNDRINIAELAALLGRREPALQQAFKRPPLQRLGETRGRERVLTLGDYALTRLAYELQAEARSIEAVWPLAAELAPVLVAQIEAAPGREIYGLVLEGIGPDAQRHAMVAEGWGELAEAVADALAKGWPRLQVVNMKALAEEILVGWSFAQGCHDELVKAYQARADTMPAEELARAQELVDLFTHRLAGRPNPPFGSAPRGRVVSLAPDTGRVTDNGTFALEGTPAPVPMPAKSPAKVKA